MKRRFKFSILLFCLALPIGLFNSLTAYGIIDEIQSVIENDYHYYNYDFEPIFKPPVELEICIKEGYWKKECILDKVAPYIIQGLEDFYKFLSEWSLEPVSYFSLEIVYTIVSIFTAISLVFLSLVSLCKCLCSSIILVFGLFFVYISTCFFSLTMVTVYITSRPLIVPFIIRALCNLSLLIGIPIGVFFIPKWKMFRSLAKNKHKHVKLELIQTE